MKSSIIFLLILTACNYPPCPQEGGNPSKPGLYSKSLGTVQIDNETCQIFETYEKYDCRTFSYAPGVGECTGGYTACNWKTLTRITKCPSNTTVNSITQTGGKFSHEEIH